MTKTSRFFASIGLFCALAIASVSPAFAQTVQVFGRGHQPIQERLLLVGNVTSNQTYATTSYADLVGSSLTTYVPYKDPTQATFQGGPNNIVYIHVVASLKSTKATGTSGVCGVYANGAIIAASEQTVTFAAGASNLAMDWYVIPTLGTTQTIKVQCKSADTSILTIADGQVRISEVF